MTKKQSIKKEKDQNYEKLANKIYKIIADSDNSYGDILASLELCKLWIYKDFTDMHQSSEQNENVDIIDVAEPEKEED